MRHRMTDDEYYTRHDRDGTADIVICCTLFVVLAIGAVIIALL